MKKGLNTCHLQVILIGSSWMAIIRKVRKLGMAPHISEEMLTTTENPAHPKCITRVGIGSLNKELMYFTKDSQQMD